jgi:hypothetical protein
MNRLGEFSPLGQLFYIGCFLKISEVAKTFDCFFYSEKSNLLILPKRVGLHIGVFFHKHIWSLWSHFFVTRGRAFIFEAHGFVFVLVFVFVYESVKKISFEFRFSEIFVDDALKVTRCQRPRPPTLFIYDVWKNVAITWPPTMKSGRPAEGQEAKRKINQKTFFFLFFFFILIRKFRERKKCEALMRNDWMRRSN